jgi:hypothetical protein
MKIEEESKGGDDGLSFGDSSLGVIEKIEEPYIHTL